MSYFLVSHVVSRMKQIVKNPNKMAKRQLTIGIQKKLRAAQTAAQIT